MYGNEPVYKDKNGIRTKYCETCGREIKLLVPDEKEAQSAKITNRCEGTHNGDTILEPCHYCHLQQHHLNLQPPKKAS